MSSHHIFDGNFQYGGWHEWRVIAHINEQRGGEIEHSTLGALLEKVGLPSGDRVTALHHVLISACCAYESDLLSTWDTGDLTRIINGMIHIWIHDLEDLNQTSAVGEEVVEGEKCVIVSSMTGDAPEEWVKIWKRLGYTRIHFTGNGCDDVTDMSQQPLQVDHAGARPLIFDPEFYPEDAP